MPSRCAAPAPAQVLCLHDDVVKAPGSALRNNHLPAQAEFPSDPDTILHEE